MRRLSALWFSKSAGESTSGGRHWDMGVGWDEGYWCTALEVTSFSITELWILRSKGLHLSVCLEYWNVIALDLVAFPKRTGLWPLALRGMWAKFTGKASLYWAATTTKTTEMIPRLKFFLPCPVCVNFHWCGVVDSAARKFELEIVAVAIGSQVTL